MESDNLIQQPAIQSLSLSKMAEIHPILGLRLHAFMDLYTSNFLVGGGAYATLKRSLSDSLLMIDLNSRQMATYKIT